MIQQNKSSVTTKLLIFCGVLLGVMLVASVILRNASSILYEAGMVTFAAQKLQIQVEEFGLQMAEFSLKEKQYHAAIEKEVKDLELRNKTFEGVKATIRQLELQNQLLKNQIEAMKKGQPDECPFEFHVIPVPPPDEPSVLKRDRSAGYRRSSRINEYHCCTIATLSYASA